MTTKQPPAQKHLDMAREIAAKISEEMSSHVLKWNRDICELIISKHLEAALTLAPNEPEVKSQGFHEWAEYNLDKDEMNYGITYNAAKRAWQAALSGANAPQCTYEEAASYNAQRAWKAALIECQKSIRGQVKLPDKSEGGKDCYDENDSCNHNSHSECDANIMYDKGFNDCLDAVKSLNEGDK